MPPRPTPFASASSLASASASAPKLPAPLAATKLAELAEGTFGPRLVHPKRRKGASGLFVAGQKSTSGRRWSVTPVDERGRPVESERRDVAEAPEEASAWDVQPLGDGYLLAWTRPTSSGEELWTLALTADGAPKRAPAARAQGADTLVAVRIVGLAAGGAHVLWAERNVGKLATVASGTLALLPFDDEGQPLASAPIKVAERLSAWSPIPFASGTLIAFVQQPAGGPAKSTPGAAATLAASGATLDEPRTARVSFVDGLNKPAVGDAVTLSLEGTALPEIQALAISDKSVLVAFGDRRDLDAHLYSTTVTLDGGKPRVARPAKRMAPAFGDQSLAGLVATKSGPAALYETVAPRTLVDVRRRFDLVRLGDDGIASGSTRAFRYPYEDSEPEVVAAGEDVAVLTSGRVCLVETETSPVRCDDGDLRPWILRYRGALLDASTPSLLYVGPTVGGAAHAAFDLACEAADGSCESLVIGPQPPGAVARVDVPKAPSAPSAAGAPRWQFAESIETGRAPRLIGAETLARESQFAGLHAVPAGKGTLVGWITYWSDDAPVEVTVTGKGKGKAAVVRDAKDRGESGGARVALRMLDAAGEPVGPTSIVSERALSKGDVAIAFAEAPNDGKDAKDGKGRAESGGGVVAYVSRAEGDEEVYVSRIDASGKKVGGSSRITRATGSASDVALVSVPGEGYVLAWVDGRGKAPAIYAVHLDKNGQKQGTEVKIGAGVSGDVADVSLAVIGRGPSGARIAAVWSDAREDPKSGFADVWSTVLGSKDLKPVVAERALAQTRLHSHNPTLAVRADGSVLVAWMEDDPSSNEMNELTGAAEWGAYVGRLDASGALAGAPSRVPTDPSFGKGVTTGIALDCAPASNTCRLVEAYAVREGIALLASPLPINFGAEIAAARGVWSYHGAPQQEVAPALVGNAAFLCEDGLEKDDGRVRRIGLAW